MCLLSPLGDCYTKCVFIISPRKRLYKICVYYLPQETAIQNVCLLSPLGDCYAKCVFIISPRRLLCKMCVYYLPQETAIQTMCLLSLVPQYDKISQLFPLYYCVHLQMASHTVFLKLGLTSRTCFYFQLFLFCHRIVPQKTL